MSSRSDLDRLTPGPDDLWFVPLGGVGEIGMNLALYGHDGAWLMVDCGVTFEESAIPGIDVIMPDTAFIEARAGALAGIVLTHAHEDHLGAVPYLWPDLGCPVYATPFTAAFLRTKLAEEGLEREVPIIEVPLKGRFTVGPFDLEYVFQTHSIPEPNSLIIRTPAGLVAHSGDWKLDPDPLISGPADTERLAAIGKEGVLAYIGDSTNIFTPGRAGSEADARAGLCEVVEALHEEGAGRIAVACFASNIARLSSIAEAARRVGREVCLAGRSLWRMVGNARATGYLTDAPNFLEADEAARLPDDRVLYILTGSQGEPRAALARIAHGSHPHISLGTGDVVVFSSRVIPGNEKAIGRMQNQLVRRGVRLITDSERVIHVSGHPGRAEVEEMYGLLRPALAVPVHGERRHLEEHARVAEAGGAGRAVVIENGDLLALAPVEEAGIIAEVPTGRLALDGERIVPLTSATLRDRKRMVMHGAAVITLVLDRAGTLARAPMVTTHGLFEPGEEEDDEVRQIVEVVRRAVNRLDRREAADDEAVIEAARTALRRAFQRDQGRKPLTDVHLVRI